jgi:glucose/arabinose dehydrogenase
MRTGVVWLQGLAVLCAVGALSACGESARLTVAEGMGPRPVLPPPDPSLIPVIDIAPATGWSSGSVPVAADGLTVAPFARDLDHPRWLYVLPNGDVLVAETNAPERPEDRKGIKGAIMGFAMKKAGSATPSANRITLLRDADRDGKPELRTTFAEGLHSPFGMALVGDDFYVANTDALVRFDYRSGATTLATAPERVAELPGGEINHHWTKNVIANRDGTRLYVTVGSNSNGSAPRSSRSTRGPGTRPFMHRACGIRTGSRGSRGAVRSGPSSTSATRSAAISCPTT